LIAKADVVEFHRNIEHSHEEWRPFPVEYKRGKPKKDNCNKVQLCGQALCLEEMLEVDIPAGALFYGKTRRRQDITFESKIRAETEDAARRFHALFDAGITPKPEYLPKCDHCSLSRLCLPKAVGKIRSVNSYLVDAVGK